MDAISATDLLEIWENGVDRTPIEQALILLQAACPHIPADELARLTIGRRDAWLFELRRQTFGSRMTGVAACPACQEAVELQLDVDALLSGDPPWPSRAAGPVETSMASFQLTFRLPSSEDVREAGEHPDPSNRLLEACVLSARKDGEAMAASDLPQEIRQAIMERMESEEPLADIALAAACPACGHRWRILLDIVSFFWGELNAWANRLMRDVHILASAYGWRERDILSMGAKRRQRYLEMVRA